MAVTSILRGSFPTMAAQVNFRFLETKRGGEYSSDNRGTWKIITLHIGAY